MLLYYISCNDKCICGDDFLDVKPSEHSVHLADEKALRPRSSRIPRIIGECGLGVNVIELVIRMRKELKPTRDQMGDSNYDIPLIQNFSDTNWPGYSSFYLNKNG